MSYSNELEYWTVGYSLKWGRWQIRRRDLDDPEKYTLVEDLGPVLRTAALEFDGDFEIAEGATHIAEFTDAVPWMAVVTEDGRLYVKEACADISTAVLLDTSVGKVSLCRTYRSVNWGVDLGFTVAYIKTNGTAWYQTRDLVSGVYVWSGPIQITDAGSSNKDIQVFRLLDYRTGIYVNGVNKLYISNREYIGNTVKSEFVDADVAVPFCTYPFRNVVEDNTEEFAITDVSIYSERVLQVQANYPIFDFDPDSPDITFSGTGTQQIDHLSWENGMLYIHMTEPISIYAGLSFTCRAANRKGYYVSPQCKPIWPGITFMLKPPPIEVIEYVDATVTVSTVLDIREKQNYRTAVTETVNATATVSTTFTALEVSTSALEFTDEYVDATVTITSTLTMTQTGVSPI